MAFVVSGLGDVCFSNSQCQRCPNSAQSGVPQSWQSSALCSSPKAVCSGPTKSSCGFVKCLLPLFRLECQLTGQRSWFSSCAANCGNRGVQRRKLCQLWAWLPELRKLGNSSGQSEGAMNPTKRGMTAPLKLTAHIKPRTCHVMHQSHSNGNCESTINESDLRLCNPQISL